MQNNNYLKVLPQVALYTNKKGDLDSNRKMCQIISWKFILYFKAPNIKGNLYYFGQGFR